MSGVYQVDIDPGYPGGYLIRFPFSEECVVDLKAGLPCHARRWDSEKRAWRITDRYLLKAERILSRHFQPAVPLDVFSTDPWETLHLRPGAPRKVVRAAYWTLSRMHHDDPQMLRRIELAWQIIKAGLEECKIR